MSRARWRVDFCDNIKINEDKWVPRSDLFRLLDLLFLPLNIKVSEFRMMDGRWNVEFIQQLFSIEDSS